MFTWGMIVLVCQMSTATSSDNCDWYVVDSFKTERECLHDISRRNFKGFEAQGFIVDEVTCDELKDNPDFE